MVKIQIKPVSVNECYTGRRFKTEIYKWYETELMYRLPGDKFSMPTDCQLKIIYEFGFSSKGSDLMNHEKCLTDILSKKYGFNDNRIYEANLKKRIVPKGEEYLIVNIIPIYE